MRGNPAILWIMLLWGWLFGQGPQKPAPKIEIYLREEEVPMKDTLKFFYPDRMPKAFLMYNDTPVVAKVIFFHRNGTKAATGYYVNRQREGTWRYFTHSGHLIMEENYRRGKLWGAQKVYYPLTGKLLRYREYVDGKLHGKWEEYFESGIPKLRGTYVNGLLEGEMEFYWPDGKIKRKGKYEKNVRVGEWYDYNRDGSLAAIRYYRKGVEERVQVFKLDTITGPPPETEIIHDTIHIIVPASFFEEGSAP